MRRFDMSASGEHKTAPESKTDTLLNGVYLCKCNARESFWASEYNVLSDN